MSKNNMQWQRNKLKDFRKDFRVRVENVLYKSEEVFSLKEFLPSDPKDSEKKISFIKADTRVKKCDYAYRILEESKSEAEKKSKQGGLFSFIRKALPFVSPESSVPNIKMEGIFKLMGEIKVMQNKWEDHRREFL